ncbi:hypothetical protein JXA85_04770 [Candidatus Woesearchaeota archaeon]|nr:hypothetical protein [Candidatus Woesearchaeota archaeon]
MFILSVLVLSIRLFYIKSNFINLLLLAALFLVYDKLILIFIVIMLLSIPYFKLRGISSLSALLFGYLSMLLLTFVFYYGRMAFDSRFSPLVYLFAIVIIPFISFIDFKRKKLDFSFMRGFQFTKKQIASMIAVFFFLFLYINPIMFNNRTMCCTTVLYNSRVETMYRGLTEDKQIPIYEPKVGVGDNLLLTESVGFIGTVPIMRYVLGIGDLIYSVKLFVFLSILFILFSALFLTQQVLPKIFGAENKKFYLVFSTIFVSTIPYLGPFVWQWNTTPKDTIAVPLEILSFGLILLFVRDLSKGKFRISLFFLLCGNILLTLMLGARLAAELMVVFLFLVLFSLTIFKPDLAKLKNIKKLPLLLCLLLFFGMVLFFLADPLLVYHGQLQTPKPNLPIFPNTYNIMKDKLSHSFDFKNHPSGQLADISFGFYGGILLLSLALFSVITKPKFAVLFSFFMLLLLAASSALSTFGYFSMMEAFRTGDLHTFLLFILFLPSSVFLLQKSNKSRLLALILVLALFVPIQSYGSSKIKSLYTESSLTADGFSHSLNKLFLQSFRNELNENICFYGMYSPGVVPYFYYSNDMNIFFMTVHQGYRVQFNDFLADTQISSPLRNDDGQINAFFFLNNIRLFGISKIILLVSSQDMLDLLNVLSTSQIKDNFEFFQVTDDLRFINVVNSSLAETTVPVFEKVDDNLYRNQIYAGVSFENPDLASKYRNNVLNPVQRTLNFVKDSRYSLRVIGDIKTGSWVHIKRKYDPRFRFFDDKNRKLESFDTNMNTILVFVPSDTDEIRISYSPLRLERILAFISMLSSALFFVTINLLNKEDDL